MSIAIIVLKTAPCTFYYCSSAFLLLFHTFYASETVDTVALPPVEPRVPVVLAGLIESV